MTSLTDILLALRLNQDFIKNVVAWEKIPRRALRTSTTVPDSMSQIEIALRQKGISSLFTHQASAIQHALNHQNVIIATATASGKSLCYTIPVLQRLLERPSARASLPLSHQSPGPRPNHRNRQLHQCGHPARPSSQL